MKTLHFIALGRSMDLAVKRKHYVGQFIEPVVLTRLLNEIVDLKLVLASRSNYDPRFYSHPENIVYCNLPAALDSYEKYIDENGRPNLVVVLSGMQLPNELNPKFISQIFGTYSLPFLRAIDKFNLPYVQINQDPRGNLGLCRDLSVKPLMTYNLSGEPSRFRAFNNEMTPSKYSGLGCIVLYGLDHYSTIAGQDRFVDFAAICHNSGRTTKVREWILNSFEDSPIYGNGWDKFNDSRFKGVLQHRELMEALLGVKCSFVIPIRDGWTTAKFFELTHAGVLTFLHPGYDKYRYLNVPEELRVKSPEELKAKVQYYCQHDREREDLVREVQKNVLLDSYYSGNFIRQFLGEICTNYLF